MKSKPIELKRYYLHGDIVEGEASTFFDARADDFLPVSKLEPVLPLDLERLRYQLSLPRKTVPKNCTRPDDPPNVFTSHEWMTIHGKRLKTLVREHLRQHGDKSRE